MGFMDKARAAANDLAAKADTALANSGMGGPGGGDADKYFRDLGLLTYLEANGRPASLEDRERVMAALQEMESRGAIRSFALQTSASSVPPPPGGSVPPPPPGGSAPPPPPGGTVPPAAPEAPVEEHVAPTAPPPPPPSWANKDDQSG